MRKNSITARALKLYHSFNPKFFPTKTLYILFADFAPYFTLWMSAEIVTALSEGQSRESIYLLIAVTLLGNLLVRTVGAVLKRVAETQFEILENNQAAALNAKTLSLDYDKLEDPAVRQHRRRIEENSYINYYGVENMRRSLEDLVSCITNLLFSAVMFAEMVVRIAGNGLDLTGSLLFAALLLVLLLNIVTQRYESKYSADQNKKLGDQLLEENRLGRGYYLSGMDNRIYKQQIIYNELRKKEMKQHREVFFQIFRSSFKLHIPISATVSLSELFAYLIVCFYCGLGVFPVGSVIKYVGYLGLFTSNLGDLLLMAQRLKVNEQYLEVYLDYFDIKNDMYQGSLSVEKRSDKKFDIEFKNVSFKYQGTDDYALKNINLDLKVGERLAVVGMNGSGKTTFIKLLCRLYDPTEGEIFMNDFNIRKYDYRQYLDLFSVVFQDYNLLSVPLGNNVASSDTWDTEKAERLLEEVGFGERYATMSRKLETPLYKDFDEDGVNVSGGEAQKIALARALYKDAPFIILDEPTAALDPIAEAEIYSKFDQIVGDKTAIYISHRLSSCRFCDKIAVFDKGEIVQIGTHEELLSDENGKYYELWHAQAQYYTEKTA